MGVALVLGVGIEEGRINWQKDGQVTIDSAGAYEGSASSDPVCLSLLERNESPLFAEPSVENGAEPGPLFSEGSTKSGVENRATSAAKETAWWVSARCCKAPVRGSNEGRTVC